MPAQLSRQYSFMHHGTTGGLISNEIFTVLQDRDGYIWIGTTNGLQRFDGVRYVTFRHQKNNPASLPNNLVYQIVLDKTDRLWMLFSDARVGYFDIHTFRFHEVREITRFAQSAGGDKSLILDEQGNIMLLTAKLELTTYNATADEFSAKYNFIPYPPGFEVSSLVQQKNTRKYWLSTNRGFVIYNSVTKQSSYAGHNVEKEPIIDNFNPPTFPFNTFFDNKGRVWFDFWGDGQPRINCYDLKTNTPVLKQYSLMPALRAYFETRGYLQQKDGTIWIRGLGVFGNFQEKEKQFQLVYNGYINEQSIVYEGLTSFCEDKEGNIWASTSNNGLYQFNPAAQYFRNIRHLNPASKQPGKGGVMSFQTLNDGTLLVGTWGDGMFRYDKNFNEIPLQIKNIDVERALIWGMHLSRDSNTIYMASQPGVVVYDQKKNYAEAHNPPIFKNNTIRQVIEDKLGNLWIGSQSTGLYKWTASKGQIKWDDGVSFFNALPIGQIQEVYEDRLGFIWVSINNSGVYVIDPETDKVVTEIKNEVDGKNIAFFGIPGILDYDDSTVVMGGGVALHLYNRNTKKLSTIGSSDFLNGTISSLQKDRKSNFLWVAMSHGIHRVNLKNKIFVHFDRQDGITDDRFVTSSAMVMKDGRMVFGADNQFTVFDPADVSITSSSPTVTITGFKLSGTPLLMDSINKLERLELNAKNNSFTVEFAGLSYNTAYLIRYKLEGVDKEWRVADKNFQAEYTYLPPGTHTFLVKSADADGNDSKDVTKLIIKINPPFWRTWWFFGLIILLAAVVLYGVDRERLKRINDLQKVRTEIATNLHEDVTATLSNINLLGEMAKMKADKDISRSKEYIDQISIKSHNMIIAMDDILWSIDPENDSMDKTILRMMEFTDSLKNRHGAIIDFALDKKVRSLKLDMKTRHDFFLIFKEGLKMIIQYAQGRNTLVNVDFFKNRLSMKLQDGSARLDANITEIEQIIKEINTRASVIRAELDIQYDRGGVAIILLVPVK